MKGIIALDIDGTITADQHAISGPVIRYFNSLVQEGWQLIFITGRPFRWAFQTLSHFSFPYTFAVQNGAVVLDMPSQRVISRNYLNRSILPGMEEICRDEPTDFVIYTGFENQDLCYYRSSHFSGELMSYLRERSRSIQENWVDISSFDAMPFDIFPAVKCFGQREFAQRISTKIENKLHFHAPMIRDPLGEGFYVVQVTDSHVNKGETLLRFCRQFDFSFPVIAAGDDINDETMLRVADIKVVMGTAPVEMLKLADIVAPSAKEDGIIQGLSNAIRETQNGGIWPRKR